MESIFPITSLSKEPKAVKDEARRGLVRITENGKAAYVFASEEVFADIIKREREDAAYEAYLLREVGAGVRDLEAGRYFTSLGDVLAEAKKRRAKYA